MINWLKDKVLKYKKKPLRERVLEGKIKELEEKNKGLVESLGKKILSDPNVLETDPQPEGYKVVTLQDITKEAYNISKNNPKFLDYLQTYKFALKNDLMNEARLKEEKRFILLGKHEAIEELIRNIKKASNT